MALYRVTFSERNGYQYQCRIRAAGQTPLEVIGLAVKKVWGDNACWVPFDATTGCVWEWVADTTHVPKTGETTVSIEPARRRRATPSA